MASFDYNPITGQLDLVGSGGGTSYIDGDVEYYSNLPVTVGTPAVNSAFLVRKGEGVYFINRKPAGIWVRELNNGNLDDWKYAGTFSDLYRDANFRIINDADTSKELAFQLSGISTGTTRTLTAPDASGTIALTSQLTDTQIFTANGTWTKPAGAKAVHYLLIGGGGGGGGGRRSDSSTAASGGQGGNGGGICVGWVDPAALGATESVTVGSGGAGGVSRGGMNDTNGANASGGGDTTFHSAKAIGGLAGGGGGTAALGYNTSVTNAILHYGFLGSASRGGGTSVTGNSLDAIQSDVNPSAGGGGGSKSSANVYYVGGDGGTIGNSQNRVGQTLGGQAAASTAGDNGGLSHMAFFGTGGAGGSPSSSTGAATKGGNGGNYGGGGGGGSGCLNDAGGDDAGGDGANGIAIITTYF